MQMSRAEMKRNDTEPAFTADKNVGKVERLASLAGGAALAAYGAKRGSGAGAAIAVVGGALVLRGATGHCPVYTSLGIDTNEPESETQSVLRASKSLRVERSVTINRQPAELYAFWRNFQNLPLFMKNLESVEVIDENRSHWTTKGPLGTTVEWDAEIINEALDSMIAWRSLEGSEVANAGSVHFHSAPGGRGTVVSVVMEYHPIGGKLAGLLAKATGTDAQTQVEQDLRRFKAIMEAGEFPTTAGQPQGGRKGLFASDEVTR
jgi:uncharacterized membrane protein